MQVSTGGKRNEKDLTDEQFQEIKKYAVYLGMPEANIFYSSTINTSYGAGLDVLIIGTDVLPLAVRSDNPNSNISWRGAVAHEIIGHRGVALKGKKHTNPLLEEVQASIRAARFTPDLNLTERYDLIRDALNRLRKNGLKLCDVRETLFIYEVGD